MASVTDTSYVNQGGSMSKYSKKKWYYLVVFGLVFLGLAVTMYFVNKKKSDENTNDSVLNEGRPNWLSDQNLHSRECLITEAKCSAAASCRGATGKLASPLAKTPDGSICCMFSCEDDYLPVRACLQSESVCAMGQKCKMGDTIVMPTAFTATGQTCCQFDCDEGDLPTRACNMGSEVVCPPGSYCYDYGENVTVPTAKMGNGNSCCRANGTNKVCVPINPR